MKKVVHALRQIADQFFVAKKGRVPLLDQRDLGVHRAYLCAV